MVSQSLKPGDEAAARDRQRPLRIYVSDAERAKIEASANAAGLSVSSFLRTVGLGYEPTSSLDHDAIAALIKVAGDQGRLGGLLKLWLAERAGEGVSEIVVTDLMDELQMITAGLRAKVLSL